MLGESFVSSSESADDVVEFLDSDLVAATAAKNDRLQTRVRINAKLRVRPSNSGGQLGKPLHGLCRDLSKNGFGAVLTKAPHVGDVYWIEIKHPEIRYEPVIARCIRCRFIAERTFEAGFAFFETPDLELPAEDNVLDLL